MKKNPLAPLGHFLGRYHVILFFLLVVGSLTYEIYTLSIITNTDPSQDTEGYKAKVTDPNFDNTTIKAIQSLRTRTDGATYALPAGRNNPFSE